MDFIEITGHLLYGALLNAVLFAAALAWMGRLIPDPSERDPRTALGSLEILVVLGIVISACIVSIVTIAGSLGWASNRIAMFMLTTAVALLPVIGSPRSMMIRLRGTWRSAGMSMSAADHLMDMVWRERPVHIALVCVAVPWLLLLSDRILAPPAAWDALTYHLTFPLHWIQSGRLDTLVQPTGEPSSTFYPLVGEIHYYWGFLSTGSDAWAGLSQAPFLLLSSIATLGIARLLGATRIGAVMAAALWTGIPVVLRQSVEPMVDLVSTAFFLSTVFLLLRLESRGEAWRLVIAAAALGLSLGVKYVGIVWMVGAIPLYLATVTGRGGSIRPSLVILSLALILFMGGYAYVRNAWVGGNPLLPLEVTIAGKAVLRGSRTMGEYFRSQLHQSVLSTVLVSPRAVLDLGLSLPVFGAGAIFALWSGLRDRRRTLVAVAATSLLSFLLFFLVVPYREPRHLLTPLALSIAVLPAALTRTTSTSRFRLSAGLLILANVPLALFYWGKDLLNAGLDVRHGIGLFLGGAALVAGLWPKPLGTLPRSSIQRTAWPLRAVYVISAVLVAAGTMRAYESHRFSQWSRYESTRIPWGSREPRPELAEAASAWSLVAEVTRDKAAAVAYAGTNTPYPLAGFALRNRAYFVPRTDAKDSWHYDWSTSVLSPFVPASPDAWLRNLGALRIRYLCVFREVSANDSLERFPIEAEWAEAHGSVFRPLSRSRWARVYEVVN